MTRPTADPSGPFAEFFRGSAPYIRAHRGRTFVICFGGEAVRSPGFTELIHDIALLYDLGVRLVLVHGARPQVERRLEERKRSTRYVADRRVTDPVALTCVKEAVGSVRVEIEALLSMGTPNSPMAGARIRVATGNFVVAQPMGVVDGVDFMFTGEVRRVDAEGIRRCLDAGAVVLLSPLGYSVTGEVFNVSSHDVAAEAAAALGADKLVALVEGPGLVDSRKRPVRELTPPQAEALVLKKRLQADLRREVDAAVRACRAGVRRAHLVSRRVDAGLLLELFTRDGIGTLITAEEFEGVRQAELSDVGGILALIGPLEERGVLVRRPRELLETDIHRFTIVERDGLVIACAALYPLGPGVLGELACVAVHPGYRDSGRGDVLLQFVERRAREAAMTGLFVLTTRASHWFRERGFEPGRLRDVPAVRRATINRSRGSTVLVKRFG